MIIRREIRKRGFFGWVFLLIFLGFNALMAVWLFNYWSQIGGNLATSSEAGRAGAAIGATIGTSMILFIWAVGAVITGLLALLTRGPKTYIEGESEVLIHRGFPLRPLPLLLFAVAVLFLSYYWKVDSPTATTTASISSGATASPPSPAAPLAPRWSMEEAISNVGFEFKWGRSGIGIMTAQFTIHNKNSYDIKDLTISCNHYAPSGTRIDSNTREIYEVFQANTKRTIRNFNMGFTHSQVHESACRITRLVKGEERAPAPVRKDAVSKRKEAGSPIELRP